MDFANDNEIRYAHDILLTGLPDFDNEKVAIIKCNESKDIKACPGSGKTTTLLAKLVILAKRMPLLNGKGICVLTHTNVAIDEIKSKLNTQAEVLFNYPNYFGTIQGFVDKFLTIPYYNSVEKKPLSIIDDERVSIIFNKAFASKTTKELKLILEQIKDRIPKDLTKKNWWKAVKDEQKKFLFNSYYDVDTKKYYREYGAPKALVGNQATPTFQLFDTTRGIAIKEGVLKYEDAFSYAIAYAKQCEKLKEAIPERFCYLFIDEMQDTNNIQYDLIGMLFDSSKIIVQRFGDPHQSIFEHGKMKWEPNNTALSINMSNRFGDNIAEILKTVCEKDNQSLRGNEKIFSLKPILLVYDEPQKVLPHFAKLVKERTINGKTILEIANELRQKDHPNKPQIKAIGWVGKDNGKGLCKINSYYPGYEQKSFINGEKNIFTLYDFLRTSQGLSIKELSDRFFMTLATILELSGIMYNHNGKSVRYTKSRIQTYLKNAYPDKYQVLRANVSKWIIDILNSKSIINKEVYAQVKKYIDKEFHNLFQFDKTSNLYQTFMAEPEEKLYKEFNIESVPQNIFVDGDVEIGIATVHSVKGETHVATLYMETSYKNKCESQRIGKQLCGTPYSGTADTIKKTLRIAYVAMSRPRYMLCMAIKKENYKQLDTAELSKLWEILEI